MKFLKFNIFILLFLTILFCIPSALFAESEEKIEKTYPLDRDGKVYIENISGDIVVKSWGKNEIKILARKIAKNKQSLDKATIDINQTSRNIRIITRHQKSTGRSQSTNVSVFYDIFIPDRAQIRVKSISGGINAWEIGGPIDFETVSGRIEIVAAKRGVKCKTISGNIYLDSIIGDADLKSTSGKILVEDIKGSVEASTVSGRIELEEVSNAEEIEVESISGNIETQGELSSGGIYEFHTISGRIRLDLPPASDFELQTKTISGNIRCGFELNNSGKIERNKKQGVVGKGRSSLKIFSLSGDIIINNRK